MQIHGTPDEFGSRHYLHARNAADALLFILRKTFRALFPDLRPDRYNITGPEPMNNLELARRSPRREAAGVRAAVSTEHRPGHDPHYGLDMGRLDGLGWKPPVQFPESLERTVRWTREHPDWLA